MAPLILTDDSGAVLKHPYTFEELQADNPNVSFADNPSDASLAGFNVYRVRSLRPQYDPQTQKLVRSHEPEQSDGGWLYLHMVVDISREELEGMARGARNQRIAEFEDEHEKDYRQHAREVRMGLTPSVDIAPLDAHIQELADWPNTADSGFPDPSTMPRRPAR